MKTIILAGVLALTAVAEVVISTLPTACVLLTLTAVSGVVVASQPAEAGGKPPIIPSPSRTRRP